MDNNNKWTKHGSDAYILSRKLKDSLYWFKIQIHSSEATRVSFGMVFLRSANCGLWFAVSISFPRSVPERLSTTNWMWINLEFGCLAFHLEINTVAVHWESSYRDKWTPRTCPKRNLILVENADLTISIEYMRNIISEIMAIAVATFVAFQSKMQKTIMIHSAEAIPTELKQASWRRFYIRIENQNTVETSDLNLITAQFINK